MDPSGIILTSPPSRSTIRIEEDDNEISNNGTTHFHSDEYYITSNENVAASITTFISDKAIICEENEDESAMVATAVCAADGVCNDSIVVDEADDFTTVSVRRLSDISCYLTYKDQTREAIRSTAIIQRQRLRCLSSEMEQELHGYSDVDSASDDEDPPLISSRNISIIHQGSTPTIEYPSISQTAIWDLTRQGFPKGLATEMAKTKHTFPVRYFLVDNSGSMLSSDCNRFVQCNDDRSASRLVNSTRWQELQDSVVDQMELAGILESETIFRLLNNPGAMVCPQEIMVTNIRDANNATTLLTRIEPNGVTPLTYHLLEIRERIGMQAQQLKHNGQKAVIVIATDGLPSNEVGESTEQCRKDFELALRSLQTLPVWIVIRLCSNDETIVKYYREIDEKLEHNIEVIGDFYNETIEIFRYNDWLHYSMPLHRCRQMGFHHRVFDLLDERTLNKEEMLNFFKILLGSEVMETVPDMYLDWKRFSYFIAKEIKSQDKHWNALTMKMEYLIDIRKFNKVYGSNNIKLGGIRRKRTDFRS